MPLDMFDEASGRLRAGPAPVVPVTPGPPSADMMDEALAKLRPEGVTTQLTAPTREDARGHVLETPGWNMGMSIGQGLTQGFLPNILGAFRAGNPQDVYREALASPTGETPEFNKRYTAEKQALQAANRAYLEQNPGKALVGELGGSLATAVPLMATGAGGLAALGSRMPWASGLVDFLSGAAQGPLRLPSLAARGAAEGTAAAGLSSGLSDKPLGEQLATGATVGALANPVLGKIADALGGHVNQTTAETAQALIDAGVSLRSGQVPGSGKVAQGLDKIFGGGNVEQREQFASKLTEHAGSPAKEINQAWVANNDKRIGTTMNNIQSVYAIPAMEHGLLTDLSNLRQHALDHYSVDNAVKINGFINKLEENLYNPMNGDVYKNLTQKGGLLDNMSKDKDIANVVPKVREAMDDAWGRALPPDKKAAWDQARKEYKITRVIDDSMGASGAAEGAYNPKKLLKAVEDRYGNTENAGELGKLARGGQFLEPPGAAPASAKPSAMKTIGHMALGAAAATAAGEGSRAITHWGPEAIAALSQHPESFALPLALAGGIYGGTKGLNSVLNSPRATQYMLDVARGARAPLLQGNNPAIPLMVEGYNRQ